MATLPPTPMSLFEDSNALSTGSQLIILTKNNDGQWINSKISGSSAAPSLGQMRWLSTVPSNSTDPVGVDGSEVITNNGANATYYAKVGGTWFKTTLNLF